VGLSREFHAEQRSNVYVLLSDSINIGSVAVERQHVGLVGERVDASCGGESSPRSIRQAIVERLSE
jgi:hypothetical protein